MLDRHRLNCLNCETALAEAARFCPHCGQRTDTARLSIGDIVRDLMHSFVNVERGPLAFGWGLLTRPGRVAREYVDGKRRRHYGPFATLAVLVGVSALAVNWSGYKLLSRDGLPPGPTELVRRHFNLLLLVQLPLLGAVCAAVFRSARLTWPEHMVLVAYTLSMRAAFFIVFIPFAYLAATTEPSQLQVYAYWGAWYVYFGWAASQFHRAPRWRSFAQGVVAAALGHAAIAAVLAGASVVYQAVVERAPA